jgi:ABC-type arginine transport system permease subunit
MCWTTAKGTTCSLIMIITEKKQVDTRQYITIVRGIPSLTTSKMILFYMGISVVEKKKSLVYFLSSFVFKAYLLLKGYGISLC